MKGAWSGVQVKRPRESNLRHIVKRQFPQKPQTLIPYRINVIVARHIRRAASHEIRYFNDSILLAITRQVHVGYAFEGILG
jgi:hypothetical protein